MKKADIVGKEFGWLTVDHYIKSVKIGNNRTIRSLWDCVCRCGKHVEATTNQLTMGNITSCGCKRKFSAVKKIKNEVGKIYSNLLVKEFLPERTKDKRTQFLCECLLCGKDCVVTGKALRQGSTKSCGCLKEINRKNFGDRTFKDLTGQTIGFLYVEGRAANRYSAAGNQVTMWNCKCLLCGGKTIVAGTALWNKHTRSCGCLHMSFNEKAINDKLIDLGIDFIHDFSFEDLISPYSDFPLRFDFAFFQDERLVGLIEYQGIQHYQKFKDGFGDMQREITDPMKKEYCSKRNIPLYEIKYDSDIMKELYTILTKIYNTSYENTVPSSQETA